ncbi:hypothetical protein [Demequina litorisediminis]|uniref:Uncharacterized protein n=1 Tax=Demequina litorisediminis TaxID=1849022 RepID=A0ABQ6ICD0_9MICO|nr:hypothetical protein [Demequina litorisediminis]GMA34738.1 hypothetical protein GCM10025876_09420 [Demequina litorisediminis]
MTATDLLVYVNAGDSDLPFITECHAEATDLVAVYVGDAEVPETVLGRAVKEVGAELFHRRSTKNGVAQFATPDAQPIRVARDPMVAAYPILNRYVGGGFA